MTNPTKKEPISKHVVLKITTINRLEKYKHRGQSPDDIINELIDEYDNTRSLNNLNS